MAQNTLVNTVCDEGEAKTKKKEEYITKKVANSIYKWLLDAMFIFCVR